MKTIITAALAALSLGACTSSEFLAVGYGAEGCSTTASAGVVTGTCRTALIASLGYSGDTIPLRCFSKAKGWNWEFGVFLVECHPVGPADAAMPK